MATNISNNSTAINTISSKIGDGFSGTNITDKITAIETKLTSKADASALDNKADKSYVDTELGKKANTTYVNNQLSEKANTNDVNAQLANKANKDDVNNTIVKAKGEVTYVNGVPSTTQQNWTPNEKDDYLLQAADDKYYYWKYIKTSSNPDTFSWEKISGGGNGEGSGTGNTTGVDLTRGEYEELTSYAVNTDYYVLENDSIRHHYRYIEVEDESTHEKRLVEIEIGITNPKKYNLALESVKDNGDTINFLNVYEFDYNESNRIDSTTDLDTIVSKRINHILLPATGSGGGGSANTLKVSPITPRSFTTALNSGEKTYL